MFHLGEKHNIRLVQPGQSIVCEIAEELSGVGEELELIVVMVGPDWLCEACHPHLGSPTTLAGQQALICKCELPKATEQCVSCNYMPYAYSTGCHLGTVL